MVGPEDTAFRVRSTYERRLEPGEKVFDEGFGLANVEYDVPVTTETRCRRGSIAKSLTSAAVGLLFTRRRTS